jgi:cytochrome P450
MRGADIQEVGKAMDEVCDYLEEQIEDRRRNPRDDLITYGIHAEYRGRRLNEDELLGYCFALFGGGLDTVSASMTHHFIHLAKHQDQQRALRETPALIEGALEDMLRAYGPVVQVRECVKPLEVLGQEIVPGERICLPTPIANRDPRLFDSPAAVRFDRKPRHYTFGVGPHACVGLHLARREMRIGIEEFISAIPQFRLNPDEPLIYNLGGLVLQPVATHLLWN